MVRDLHTIDADLTAAADRVVDVGEMTEYITGLIQEAGVASGEDDLAAASQRRRSFDPEVGVRPSCGDFDRAHVIDRPLEVQVGTVSDAHFAETRNREVLERTP